jgi:hypothetical protein|tara:strand:- start:254 stop:802 length:549 start_codon:yes stop_codon:yes gene_type:complete
VDEYTEEMEEELHDLSQEVGLKVKEFTERVHPLRIALAGLVLLMMLGALASTWHWVIPRDDVEIQVTYLQRNGHIVLTELVNDGSREITDVTLQVEFIDKDNLVIADLQVSFDVIPSHTSISGDQMELIARGYTVWDEYSIHVSIEWTNFRGYESQEEFVHFVSESQTATFSDECEGVTWFL